MKKLLTILLTVLMVLSMSAAVFAEGETPTGTAVITIEGTKSGHSFELYQLLTGTVTQAEGSSEKTLTNIAYGQNAPAAIKTAYKDANEWAQHLKDNVGHDGLNAYFKGEDMQGLGTAYKTLKATGNKVSFTQLPDGYYLVLDKDDTTIPGDAHANYIVKVAGGEEVVVNLTSDMKIGYPTLTKRVKEDHVLTDIEVKVHNVAYPQYNDTAAYSIGDKVPFVLFGTLPTNYVSYATYKYEFYDALPEGLTYVEGSIHVYAINGNAKEEITTNFTTNFTPAGENARANSVVEVKFADLKKTGANSTTTIAVEYQAVLNENATLGADGNINTAKLVYSNDPKAGGEGKTGTTEEDKTVVYTFGLNVTKLNAQSNIHGTHTPLEGAEFNLFKAEKSGTEYKKVGSAISAVKKDAGYVIGAQGEAATTTFVTAKDGSMNFVGLDEGLYILEETEAPEGFNLPASPIVLDVKINLTHTLNWDNQTSQLHELSVEPINSTYAEKADTTDMAQAGVTHMNVYNTSATQLPTTGGMGTTVIYVAGALMALTAGVLLVIKKRTGNSL